MSLCLFGTECLPLLLSFSSTMFHSSKPSLLPFRSIIPSVKGLRFSPFYGMTDFIMLRSKVGVLGVRDSLILLLVVEQAHPLGPAYSFPNIISILPLISYRLVSITTAYSIGFEP